MNDYGPPGSLGAAGRAWLAHAPVADIFGRCEPLPVSAMQGLAYIDDPTLDRKPIRLLRITDLPDRRARSRDAG